MTVMCRLAVVSLGLVVSTVVLPGQPRYRDFQLGADLASVSARTGMASSEAKTVHVRPAVMQELKWWLPSYVGGSTAPQSDPVQAIVFSFYNDQLFRLVIDYDSHRTEGMTDADMVDALSGTYGVPSQPGAEKASAPVVPSQLNTQFGTTVAQWEGPDYSVVLYRSRYGSSLRVIVTSPRLDALARTADAQAVQLDELEAPQREAAQREKSAEATRVSQEKARVTNKAAFRP